MGRGRRARPCPAAAAQLGDDDELYMETFSLKIFAKADK